MNRRSVNRCGSVLLLGLALVLAGCGPSERVTREFADAVAAGDLDRAWELTGRSDAASPTPALGFGRAITRAHFDATFGPVREIHRSGPLRWEVHREDGIVFTAGLSQADNRAWVPPTGWVIRVIDAAGAPVGLWVDGHPAAAHWLDRSNVEWRVDVLTFEGPRLFEVELARGGRMQAWVDRDTADGQPPNCCVEFRARRGEVRVTRAGW